MSADSDSFAILSLEGDIDLYHSTAVKEHLAELIDHKSKRILVDLSAVTYIDSSGLAALIEALQKVMAYGGTMALFAATATVQHIFQVARLDQVFRLFPDEASARSSL